MKTAFARSIKNFLRCTGFSLLFLITVSARGQTYRGAIGGVVRDASGGVLVGATVIARNTATGQSRSISSAYSLKALLPRSCYWGTQSLSQ